MCTPSINEMLPRFLCLKNFAVFKLGKQEVSENVFKSHQISPQVFFLSSLHFKMCSTTIVRKLVKAGLCYFKHIPTTKPWTFLQYYWYNIIKFMAYLLCLETYDNIWQLKSWLKQNTLFRIWNVYISNTLDFGPVTTFIYRGVGS